MSATYFLSPNSNTLYLHFNYVINHRPVLTFKSFNSKFTAFSTKVKSCKIEFENHDYGSKSEPNSHSSSAIKGPTAPWMRGPLLVEPNQVLDLSKPRKKKDTNLAKTRNPGDALSGKVSGGRGKKAMKHIYQGIEKLQETHDLDCTQEEIETKVEFQFPPGALTLRKDVSSEFVKQDKVVETVEGLEGMEFDIFSRRSEGGENRKNGGKLPWEREERIVHRRMKKESVVTAAELTLDTILLERLRAEATKIKKWVKVKKVGVTQVVIDQIRLIWRDSDLAMLKFDLPLCRNLDRAQEIVEMKTGGFVVWRMKDALVVYRGCHYPLRQQSHPQLRLDFVCDQQTSSSIGSFKDNIAVSPLNSSESSVDEMISGENFDMDSIEINGSLYEREANRLLDGLGPRYVDWWWPKPLPVDADFLPEVVPGFKPPLRLCPPRSSSKLTDDELTQLRKLAHPLPTHFVLGRNRKLQGLATAIIRLWEKCHIAKIALKWGIQNTNNELMANELKNLTGGVLILRNKFFIILYRGKDFLPSQVANLVAEREVEIIRCQLQEEAARLKAIETLPIATEESISCSSVGTLSEFQTITKHAEMGKEKPEIEVRLVAEKENLEKELRYQEHRLSILKKKIEKSSRVLGKLNATCEPAKQDGDNEIITQEERESLRQIGLKMNRSLALGRRGVFDGVVAGLHQHWKHREVVKVTTMQKLFSQIIHTATLLEAESGGILVSLDKLKEGHAIIIYRGKNYRRPDVVPQNLLNKRQALCWSLEKQRVGSLKYFAKQTEKAISDLKFKLVEYTGKIGQMEEI